MASLRSVLASAVTGLLRPRRTVTGRPAPTARPAGERPGEEPGRHGREATTEVDPRRISGVRMSYVPETDGDPDPGEIVWTWVPYEEDDGRGKDRPVLVVAAEASSATVLAVQLTSKHSGRDDEIAIGAGGWDAEHRPSWVKIGRVFRVHPGGMRREASSLDRRRFERVADALVRRYGWTDVDPA